MSEGIAIKRILSIALALVLMLTCLPAGVLTVQAEADQETVVGEESKTAAQNPFAGKKVSILSHSASTYAGVSNNTADNSTIGNNDIYYTEGRHGVYRKDTWWQQTIDALGMELVVNNSWSGSCIFQPRKGAASVGYGDRAVNLHNDRTGEEPDIIWVYLGCNDFAYYKDTFGKAADVDYSALIQAGGDGTYSYAVPQTACEAYAIMLHKVQTRYPDAKIYCMTSTARRDPDYTGDNYPDAGQPTAYSAQLHQIAQYFGYPIIDLEKAIPKEAEVFDQYMGDKRAHPNGEGMDRISQALISTMLGKETKLYDVSGTYSGAETDNPAVAAVEGMAYEAKLTADPGYFDPEVTVTMDGVDVTQSVYANGTIHIESVTGDIAITVTASRDLKQFRWEVVDGNLTSTGNDENALTALTETITDGVIAEGKYQLAIPVILKHDQPWVVEWKCLEDWRGIVLSTDFDGDVTGRCYLARTVGGQLCFGTWTGKQYDNYGVDLSGLDTQTHTYRIENRIAADGSNMAWLYLDGIEMGPMNQYFIGSKAQGSTSDWLSGKDFVLPYIGMDTTPLKNCQLEYLSVWEDGQGSGSAASDYRGKVISILSASTSTFAGYIPVADGFNLAHRARYPQDNLLTDVKDTWWMQVITELDAKLGINDSWAGSQVTNMQDTNSGDLGPDAAMASLTRIRNLGANGTPDMILVYAGGNDMGRGVTLGSFDPATAPTQVDLTSYKWSSFADAYVAMIMRLQHFYPDSQIVVITSHEMPSYVTAAKLNKYGPVIRAICDHYGVPYIDLRDCGITFDMLPDNIHPNAEGMDYITRDVIDTLFEKVQMESGEHTVYSVTHNLSSVKASLSYYKGVSAGKSFTETLAGEDLTVSVAMGGKDITASAYKNGTIHIPNVTGDVVITARAAFNADGHLQQLPEHMCAGTNLWTALEPENIYYTVDGWGLFANAPDVHSITFPVTAGERVWATSFGAYPGNGSSANGTRITWFNENGLLKTVDRNTVYNEFKANGYITVPEGATALNVPMTGNKEGYAVYLLDRAHDYASVVTEPTCTEQGYTTHTCTHCGHSYTEDYAGGKKAVICFTFDDGNASDSTAYSIFREKGMVCNFALVSTVVNSDRVSDYLRYQREGFGILSHSTDGATMNTESVGTEIVAAKMSESKSKLEKAGFLIDGWVTPSSTLHNPYVPTLMQYYDYGFTVYLGDWDIDAAYGYRVPYNTVTDDVYRLHRVSMESTSVARVKLAIDNAVADGGFLNFYAHGFSRGLEEDGMREILDHVAKYVDSGECVVTTVSDGFAYYYGEGPNHCYQSVTTLPTCLDRGYTTHTCALCGHSYVDSYTEATGHCYEKGICVGCGAHLPGDINGDGKVNNKDATRLFQHLSGWTVEVAEPALDVNGDGKVNNKDATRLFQYLSGWQVEIH